MATLGGAEVFAGGASLLGGLMTNQSNARMAHEQMRMQNFWNQANHNFEWDQANLNRNFQERMSSTAHQREVGDLAKAGLNPILSATGGPGASTPSGAKGSVSSSGGAGYTAVDALGNAVNSAMAARRNRAEVENMEANTRERDSHRALLNLQSNTETVEYQRRLAQKDAARTEADILSHQEKGWRVEGRIDESSYGSGLRYADRVGKTIGSALGARRLFNQR